MISFSRTDPGLAAEHLFYSEILVYVEGHTDIPFYNEVLQNYNCRIISKKGKSECEKFATLLEQDNYPYVVVLDGDYEILVSTQNEHSRVILLDRYSFENYLFEEEPIVQFCRHRRPRANLERLVNRFREVVENIEVQFKELIVLDVAHQHSHTGYKALPDKPNQFFGRGPTDFRDSEIWEWCRKATQGIDEQSIEKVRILVNEFLKRHRLIDLLPGHFAFTIMRRLIIKTVNRSIADDDITIPLSTSVWDLVETRDHNSLKRRLRRAVREAEQIRQANNSQTQSNAGS